MLLDGLYWEHWYDVSATNTSKDDRNILYENRLLGVPRIRQVGVVQGCYSCITHLEIAEREMYEYLALFSHIIHKYPSLNLIPYNCL